MTQGNQQAEPGSGQGGYGSPTPEDEIGGAQAGSVSGPGSGSRGFDTNEPQSDGAAPIPHDPAVPSADAEIDASNDDSRGSAPESSESGQEAAGLPDGSGNDLPHEESPKDDDEESFDAG